MTTQFVQRLHLAQSALKDILEAAEDFDATLELGGPLKVKRDHAWVSTNTAADIKPRSTTLSLLESNAKLGFGVAVTRPTSKDGWEPLRTRIGELGQAAEVVLRDNPTLAGTVSWAHLSALRSTESVVDDRTIRIEVIFEVTASLYVTK